MHVLDNPVWHALDRAARNGSRARPVAARYVPDVAVFAALPDDATPDAWDDAARARRPGRHRRARARRTSTVPDGWTVAGHDAVPADVCCPTRRGRRPTATGDDATRRSARAPTTCRRCWRSSSARGPGRSRRARSSSAPTSASATAARLIAMAGERMHPPGFTEISAVCTDAAHRGRGLASQLVRALVRGIRDAGRNAVPAPDDRERGRAPGVRRARLRDPGASSTSSRVQAPA